MKRKHLFEFEDQTWFPSFLRNYLTDFLQFVSNRFNLYKGIVPLISETLSQSGTSTIVDLASGGGGGLVNLVASLEKDHPSIQVVLTDYFPNERAFQFTSKQSPRFTYRAESINAMDVPKELVGLRTQFLSLHHFREDEAVKIIQNALDAKASIAFFETQERNVKSVLAMIFSPINVLFVTPFIRPFSFGRLVFTYIIPLVPLFVMIDGILSALRTYSIPEMEELVSQVKNSESYTWKIGRKKSGPASVLYLIGTPN
jgi:hypothetical protein